MIFDKKNSRGFSMSEKMAICQILQLCQRRQGWKTAGWISGSLLCLFLPVVQLVYTYLSSCWWMCSWSLHLCTYVCPCLTHCCTRGGELEFPNMRSLCHSHGVPCGQQDVVKSGSMKQGATGRTSESSGVFIDDEVSSPLLCHCLVGATWPLWEEWVAPVKDLKPPPSSVSHELSSSCVPGLLLNFLVVLYPFCLTCFFHPWFPHSQISLILIPFRLSPLSPWKW